MEILKRAIKYAYRRYLLDAMSGFALGLFSSLVIGLIIGQLSRIPLLNWMAPISGIVGATSPVVGAAIGVGIASALKAAPLVMFSSAATGALGYSLSGPVGAYIGAVVGAEIGRLVAGKTKVDILLVPFVTLISGGLIAMALSPGVNRAIEYLQGFLEMATTLRPVFMGIIVSAVFGLALTGPISSAALAAMLFTPAAGAELGPGLLLAAGAATVGCCCHMIGFAVTSFRENGVAGLISQGLGTSKLQIRNAIRRPAILIPPTLASAILGPFATTVFQMKNASASAGMGTSGLVGQFGTWAAMMGEGWVPVLIKIGLLHFILPAALSLICAELLRKTGVIKPGDMKLEL